MELVLPILVEDLGSDGGMRRVVAALLLLGVGFASAR
jgi:hypothetical protein